MNKLVIFSLIALGIGFASCQSKKDKTTAQVEQQSKCTKDCSKCSKPSETKLTADAGNVAGVYYFHGDRKCKTCKAVGEKAKEVAEKLNVKFFDINLDEGEDNKVLAKKFQASGSGLYIKSAKSDKIEDLTTFAFRNAINDTGAYIEKLESTIKAEL